MKYQAVIGLEIHVQLKTLSKAFCSDSTVYGEIPNSQVSPISLGHPGTLPKHNENAIAHAVRLGLALNCKINPFNAYARKNYFYADLPKGYQITQDKTPICTGGYVEINTSQGPKKISLTRIHMEEDSGKSMHDQDLYDSLVDYNRAGIPLVEIVTEPVISSGEEAYHYVSEIRRLVRYLDICDGNMEEGSLRCDANISVKLKDAQTLGTKVEVKNMNSMTNVKRAIEFEIQRQIDCLEKGETLVSETRSFNAAKGNTVVMRSKEEAQDYRYFPEPDLPPFIISNDFIEQVKATMPALPKELFQKLTQTFQLGNYEAEIITEDKDMAHFYLELVSECTNFKGASNWLLGPIKSWMNENALNIGAFPIGVKTIAQLIEMVDQNQISHTVAVQNIFPVLIHQPDSNPLEIAKANHWLLNNDTGQIEEWISLTLERYPDKVSAYKAGKKGLMGLFVGEVMKLSKGSADPKTVNQLLQKTLEN